MKFDVSRSEWENPAQRVNGPAFDYNTVDWVVIHYTAANRLSPDVPQVLRNIQSDYVRNRGYSIGYNAAVGCKAQYDGVTFELRGDTFRCAANGNAETNRRGFAIVVLVDGQEAASNRAVSAVQNLVAQIRQRRPNAAIIPHSQIRATSCPGLGLHAQIRSGALEPQGPTGEDIEMIALDWNPGQPNFTAFTWTGTHLAWVVNGHVDQTIRAAGVRRQTVNDATLLGVIQGSKTTTPAPPTLSGQLAAAWRAAGR
jgi:hypothetical protein